VSPDQGADVNPTGPPASPGGQARAQTVLATSTLQPALWATLLGTEPRIRRFPRMPLLPTTIRSAPTVSATRTMTSAGSPASEWILTEQQPATRWVGHVGPAGRHGYCCRRLDPDDQVERGLVLVGQSDGQGHCFRCRVGTIGADDDVGKYQGPPPVVTALEFEW
jgi:hypothetical protein